MVHACVFGQQAVKTVTARKRVKASREQVKPAQKRAVTEMPEYELPKPFLEQVSKFRKHESEFVTRCGPRKMIDRLHVELVSQSDREEWLAHARIEALLGGCAGSIERVLKVAIDVTNHLQ